jgi:hypothetical protein
VSFNLIRQARSTLSLSLSLTHSLSLSHERRKEKAVLTAWPSIVLAESKSLTSHQVRTNLSLVKDDSLEVYVYKHNAAVVGLETVAYR